MALVLAKRAARFDFSSEKIGEARKMARAGASVAEIADHVGWPGTMDQFRNRLHALNIKAGRMQSAVEYGE
jgi:hypothetical protein